MDTILLVEGDLHQQLLYSEELHDEGWQVICVMNGQEAIEAAEANPIDCVVLDAKLPHLDEGNMRPTPKAGEDHDDGENGNGMNLLSQIRQHWPQLPVVIYTTQAWCEAKESQKEILKRGANACLLKDGDPSKLITAVHSVLERAAEQRLLGEQTSRMASPLNTGSRRHHATNRPSASTVAPSPLRLDTRVNPYQDPGYNSPH